MSTNKWIGRIVHNLLTNCTNIIIHWSFYVYWYTLIHLCPIFPEVCITSHGLCLDYWAHRDRLQPPTQETHSMKPWPSASGFMLWRACVGDCRPDGLKHSFIIHTCYAQHMSLTSLFCHILHQIWLIWLCYLCFGLLMLLVVWTFSGINNMNKNKITCHILTSSKWNRIRSRLWKYLTYSWKEVDFSPVRLAVGRLQSCIATL